MIVRPTFVGWITIVAQLPLQLFFTIWAGGFSGGFSSALLGIPGKAPFVFFGAAAFVILPVATYMGKRLNYARTEYKLYDDRVEFEEGFFSRNSKSIRYRDVLEVSLRRGLLQQACGLGTIYLGTLATGSSPRSNAFNAFGFGNVSASGIGLCDLQQPEDAYARIRGLIEAAKSR